MRPALFQIGERSKRSIARIALETRSHHCFPAHIRHTIAASSALIADARNRHC